MFETNMGSIDRIVRLLLAIIVAAVSISLEIYVLLILPALLIFTVVTSFCGIYKLLGISTCPHEVE
ncbi:MAG: YgaP family membrane protein [Acholeplasmataceae bacterium]